MKVSEAKSRRQRQASMRPSQSTAWNRILAVLEMLVTKKELANIHLLIAPLFDLLKICLDEEEQAPLEYSKQLILSCLLSCCQKLSPGLLRKHRFRTCSAKDFNESVLMKLQSILIIVNQDTKMCVVNLNSLVSDKYLLSEFVIK